MKTLIFVNIAIVASIFSFLMPSSLVGATESVNNFEIQHYRIEYELSRDAEKRSMLKTTETIIAHFPETDQNHGIERAIPHSYDSHPTSLEIKNVQGANNQALPYTTYESHGNTVVRIGEADRFVHGQQTYKITYIQRDVTKYFHNTNADELYWDTNGTDWAVPIRSLQVSMIIDESIASSMTGNHRCYVGQTGATTQCNAIFSQGRLSTSATNLSPGTNITLAVGFKPHTFAPYQPSLAERLGMIWVALLVVTLPLAFIAIIWFSIRYSRRSNRTAELGTIVPEYLPPKEASVSTAGTIAHKYGHVFSAQLIDLAVRHYIKIYQTHNKSLFRSANYELEITKDITDLRPEEQEVLKDIFDSTAVGSRLDMATLKRNYSTRLKLGDNQKKLVKE